MALYGPAARITDRPLHKALNVIGNEKHNSLQKNISLIQIVNINCDLITNWESFHLTFRSVFGFPDFYGNNMNAWIDCMSYIDDKDSGMTNVIISDSDTLLLNLENSENFKKRCIDIYFELLECVAFVNCRNIERNSGVMIAVSSS